MAKEAVSFEISVDGDVTGRHYEGKFYTRTQIGWSGQMRQGKVRRELLGPDYMEKLHEDGTVSTNASIRERNQAEILSYLAVHLVADKCPDWFTKELAMGTAAEDDNLMQELHDKARDLENNDRADVKKAAAANADKLKAQAEEISKQS